MLTTACFPTSLLGNLATYNAQLSEKADTDSLWEKKREKKKNTNEMKTYPPNESSLSDHCLFSDPTGIINLL